MLHFSKEKLHNIYPEVSPMCDKCKSSTPTHLHSYALCPKIFISCLVFLIQCPRF